MKEFKINLKNIIYPSSTLLGSFLGLFSLLKVSTLSQSNTFNELLVLFVASGGSGFIATWSPFFSRIKKSNAKNVEFFILFLPLMIISLFILFFSLPLGFSFFVGGIQSSIFEILISKKKGFKTIFWAIFIHSAVILALSLPFDFIRYNWFSFYPFLYFITLIFYLIIFREFKIKEFFFKKIKFKKYISILKSSFKNLLKHNQKDFKDRNFYSRIILAFLTSSLYSVSAVVITVLSPTQEIPILLLLDRISFSVAAASIKRFEVIGFFETDSIIIKKNKIIFSTILSITFILIFIIFIYNLNFFPFNLSIFLIAKTNLASYYDSEINSTYGILKILLIIFLISITNSLQLNTTYSVRALQFISQDNLRELDIKSQNSRKHYIGLFCGVILGFLFLLSQRQNTLSFNKLFIESQIYHFIPVILLLFWWIFVTFWGMFAHKYLLKKKNLLDIN